MSAIAAPDKGLEQAYRHNEDKNLGTVNDNLHGTFSVYFCNFLFRTWQFIQIWL